MEDKDLAQFKLTCGSEIVCEVMEWPDDESNQIIVRNAMCVIDYEYEGPNRAYAFRPWVHFLDDDKDYVMVNSDHIISMNRPTEYLTDQYQLALYENLISTQRRLNEYNKFKLNGLQALAESLQKTLGTNKPNLSDSDQTPSNIIKFPTDDMIH